MDESEPHFKEVGIIVLPLGCSIRNSYIKQSGLIAVVQEKMRAIVIKATRLLLSRGFVYTSAMSPCKRSSKLNHSIRSTCQQFIYVAKLLLGRFSLVIVEYYTNISARPSFTIRWQHESCQLNLASCAFDSCGKTLQSNCLILYIIYQLHDIYHSQFP